MELIDSISRHTNTSLLFGTTFIITSLNFRVLSSSCSQYQYCYNKVCRRFKLIVCEYLVYVGMCVCICMSTMIYLISTAARKSWVRFLALISTTDVFAMGAHGSREKLGRSASERFIQNKFIEQERERFSRFGKRARGKLLNPCFPSFISLCLSL